MGASVTIIPDEFTPAELCVALVECTNGMQVRCILENRKKKAAYLNLRRYAAVTFASLMPRRLTSCYITCLENSALRLIVNLIASAHGRGFAVELATLLTADLAAAQLPDITPLRTRFFLDLAGLPEVIVHLKPLIDYDQVLGLYVREAG